MKTAITTILMFLCIAVSAQNPSLIVKLSTGKAPVIDGTIESLWDTIAQNKIERNFTGELPSVNSYWKGVWNDTAIFILVSVTDDHHCDKWCSLSDEWMSDKPEIYFDVNTYFLDGLGPNNQSTGHIQFAPSFINGVNQFFKYEKSNSLYPYSYSYKISGQNYVFEYAIRKDGLKDKYNNSFTGKTFGFDVCIIDRDSINESRKRAVWRNIGSINENYFNMDSAGIVTMISYAPEVKLLSVNSIVKAESLYDLNTVPLNTAVTKELIIKNTGKKSLELSSITMSGAGYSIIRPVKTTLITNDTTKLRVTFINNTEGIYNGLLTINSNDGLNKSYKVNFKASVSKVTKIESEAVYGTWTKEHSPYFICNNIIVPKDSLLTINAGVKVMFMGHYNFKIDGRLNALGAENDSIYFQTQENDTIGLSDFNVNYGSWNGFTWNNWDNHMKNYDSSCFKYCVFKYSKSENGGAINIDYFPKLKLYNCRFYRNFANGGGAIYLKNEDDIYINNCLFEENHSKVEGGAITYYNTSDTADYAKILNCTFKKNNAYSKGGAIFLSLVKSNLLIENCLFFENKGSQGGAIFTDVGTTPLTIQNSIFSRNASFGDGGAIYFNFGGVVFQNCLINNNYAGGNAGAVFFDNSDDFVGNCIFSNNQAAADGGAFIIRNSSPVFANNSIVNNSGTYDFYAGVAFWDYSAAEFYNNIIWGNAHTNGTSRQISVWQSEESPIFKNCIIEPGDIYSSSSILKNAMFVDTIGKNPLFEGPTAGIGLNLDASLANWRLKNNSPGINKGISVPRISKLTMLDFYKQNRILNGIIDIGATESHIEKVEVTDTIKFNTVWIADTVFVRKNVYIVDTATLTISPGTIVVFNPACKIKIAGTIKAIGSKDKKITFTASDKSVGWLGLDFNNDSKYWTGADGAMCDNDTSYLKYCVFKFAKYSSTTENLGGAVNVRFFSRLVISECLFTENYGNWGGALLIANQSNPIISNNIFYKNTSIQEGGAISVRIKSKPLIINNLIANNTSQFGGGISLYNSDALIVNNVISNNQADFGGGLVSHYFCEPVLINNSVVYNYANDWGGGLQAWESEVKIYNSLFWNNQSNYSHGHEISTDSYGVKIYNSNIKDYNNSNEYSGVMNDTSNLFSLKPEIYKEPIGIGNSGDGLGADFHILSTSGNIDKGNLGFPYIPEFTLDFYGSKRINNGKIDIGAVENQDKKLEFLEQPIGNTNICAGNNMSFTVKVSDTAKYQWQKDGLDITGANSNSYTINSIKESDEGNYTCVVSNGYGKIYSNPVFIKIRTAPQITENIKGSLVQKEGYVNLQLKVDGSKPMVYKWTKDNITLQDTTNNLQIDSFYKEDEGVYLCKITNSCGSVLSKTAELYMAPSICMVTVTNPNTVIKEKGTALTPNTQLRGKTYAYNTIIWDKSESRIKYAKYAVYRESTVAGYYDRIGIVNASNKAIFYDTVVDPKEQSFLYKITGIRNDNTETDINLCSFHKTMHLLTIEGVGKSGFQLTWDQYIGFNYNTYYIYRSRDSINFQLYDSVSISSRSWTDIKTNSDTVFYYFISVKKKDPCNAARVSKAGGDIFDQSESSIEDNRLRSGSGIMVNTLFDNFNCYPNPFNDEAKIGYTIKNNCKVLLELYDQMGKLISVIADENQQNGYHEYKLNVTDYKLMPGIYILKLRAGNSTATRKLVLMK